MRQRRLLLMYGWRLLLLLCHQAPGVVLSI
jgi:hypothetical protein